MTEKRPTRIRRAVHDEQNPYFIMRRDSAQDDKISWEARGVLAYILSKPDDWVVQVKDLQQKKCGRDKVYRILDELKSAGYLERERRQIENGRFEWGDYLVNEHPFPENPYTAKPDTVIPYTENKELTKNRTLQKKDSRVKPALKVVKPQHTENAQLIVDAWGRARGFAAVDLGAPIGSDDDWKSAEEMALWERPPNADEIKYCVTHSTAYNYPVRFLKKDVVDLRAKNAKKGMSYNPDLATPVDFEPMLVSRLKAASNE